MTRVGQPRLAVFAATLLGLLAGIGAYTFAYARGYSYLTDNPGACANCHVMRDHFAAWSRSSHAAVAVCNDCHTPDRLIPKYVVKAQNGFWHSFYFTTGIYPDPLRITPRNLAVTEQACRTCHGEITQSIEPIHSSDEASATSCIRCHNEVGHIE